MKYVKMLGLAAMAAMALIAFGAGSASATTLYSTGAPLSSGQKIHAELESGKVVLSSTAGGLIDECEVSTAEGSTSNTSGTTVTISFFAWHWTKCVTVTLTIVSGTWHISSSGMVTGSGWIIKINFSGVECRYGTGAGTALGTLNTGKLAINAVINEQEPKAFLCPDTTKLVANYKITSPHDLTAGA